MCHSVPAKGLFKLHLPDFTLLRRGPAPGVFLERFSMPWLPPLPLQLIPTIASTSFLELPSGCTGLPLGQHPGAFAVQRKNHVHEGVDLYAPCGTPVLAVEPGVVIAEKVFTGPELGQPWWHPTRGVWVQGKSGVVLYGELHPRVKVGETVAAGDCVGLVARVLKKDKGRPMSMLHLELHVDGSTDAPEWSEMNCRPHVLRDPTPFLLKAFSAQAKKRNYEFGCSLPSWSAMGLNPAATR